MITTYLPAIVKGKRRFRQAVNGEERDFLELTAGLIVSVPGVEAEEAMTIPVNITLEGEEADTVWKQVEQGDRCALGVTAVRFMPAERKPRKEGTDATQQGTVEEG